jgi:lysylphosphatidylglycerol synthetase-like protein (DUF2156 family)
MPPSPAPNLSRRALAALALTAGLTFSVAAGASAQVPTTTVPGVLVPGDTTATTVAPTTTTTEAPAAADDGLLDFDFDANEKVWIIVVALVAVALLLLVLTIIYWRHTQPDRPKADRRVERADRKEQKQRRRASGKDTAATDAEPDRPADTPSAPMDLDEVLSTPDPARSVFGTPDEPEESPR